VGLLAPLAIGQADIVVVEGDGDQNIEEQAPGVWRQPYQAPEITLERDSEGTDDTDGPMDGQDDHLAGLYGDIFNGDEDYYDMDEDLYFEDDAEYAEDYNWEADEGDGGYAPY